MSTTSTTAAATPASASTEPATTTPCPVPPTATSFPDLPNYAAHPVYASLISRIRRAEKFGLSVADDDRHLYRAFKFGTYTDAKPEPAAAKPAGTPAKGSKGKATPSSSPAPAKAEAKAETEQGEVTSTGRRGGRRSRVSSTSAAAKLASGILDQGKTAVDSVQSGRVSKRSATSVAKTPAAATTKAAASKPAATPASLLASLTDDEKLERLRRGRKFQVQSADMTALEAWYTSKHGGENGTSSV